MLTIALTTNGRNHATVWVADAVILACLLTRSSRDWPWLIVAGWLANLLANAVTRGWMPGLAYYASINMAQTWLAATMLSRGRTQDSLLSDVRTVIRFILVAGVIAPLLGGVAGSVASLANYGQPFGDSLLRWYASNALGLLIGTPFLKALIDGSYAQCFARRTRIERVEAIALLVLHVAVTTAVFTQTRLPLLFVPYSSLLLMAFRLERLGTKAGVAVVAVIGSIAASRGLGPMALMHEGPVFGAIFFQVYLGFLLCTALTVAATVSARREALTRVAMREEALRMVMTYVPDVVLGFDAEGVCRWAHGPLDAFAGLDVKTLPGCALGDLALVVSPALLGVTRMPGQTIEFSPLRRRAMTLEASVGSVAGQGDIGGTVVVLRDVTARKAREDAIERRAETDDLTAVFNRLGFRTRLEAAVAAGGRARALAIIDIDHFKAINDTLGHAVGDRALRAIADHLQRGVRDSDVIGRIGGDEFAIIFNCSATIARGVCERISDALRARPLVDDDGVQLVRSISCGLAELQPGMDPESWIAAADSALYEVKRAGRDGVLVAA